MSSAPQQAPLEDASQRDVAAGGDRGGVWVIDEGPHEACFERLGDARRLAAELNTYAAALLVGATATEAAQVAEQGAALVLFAPPQPDAPRPSSVAVQTATARLALANRFPRAILAGGDPRAREWAALLAASMQWRLASPALVVERAGDGLAATQLDASGRRARRVRAEADEVLVATFRLGVAERGDDDCPPRGQIRPIDWVAADDPIAASQTIPGKPAEVDIRFVDRLVAGGKGVGGKEGFAALRRFAEAIDAGVAASRMAVDLNWIERERQVGQTGKSVAPDLYIACGISGASHHIEGMSQARHIVAVNTDPEAPIFRLAHLGLVADLFGVLDAARRRLQR